MTPRAPEVDDVVAVIREAIPGSPALGPDTDLLASGLLDSLSILATVNALEAGYGIEFEPDLLIPETFVDARAVWRALLTCLQAA